MLVTNNYNLNNSAFKYFQESNNFPTRRDLSWSKKPHFTSK